MSVAMDRALMALSLEDEQEEEAPFTMPELPGFSSAEENSLSIMGRLLNPECQKMSGLILTMPRKWQKEGRVRGVALSQEKFQFIFQHEHDLQDVLEKGIQTFNEWALVIERWVENPPEDYLQYIPLWVRISKIPVNYYTTPALMTLGEMIGEVKVLAFDPSKPITQDFIRVQVRFNVAKPLKMARVLDMGGGATHTIHFDYEKLQKRCFHCKRLNHEQQVCPFLIKKRQDAAKTRRANRLEVINSVSKILTHGDPLFGVLEEEQVGTDPLTGRPKIAKEVLEEMRRFLSTETGEDLSIKIDKVKRTVKEAESNPVSQKTILRLEAPPIITQELNKGKGPVFDYGNVELDRTKWDLNVNPNKLMAASMRAHSFSAPSKKIPPTGTLVPSYDSEESFYASHLDCPTVFRAGSSEPYPTGTGRKQAKGRRRPPRAQRQTNQLALTPAKELAGNLRREGKEEIGSRKRKKTDQGAEACSLNKQQCLLVIPNEGSPSP
ncbi:uncharacterized protein LOC125607168 [Brassica napus]|uniref:uncharacterized protein LOC125607168 n=1 Tax=Brassica napus TaxID=3708 RepID=UPI002078ED85|nr:uncharacterized protein LOC125607168 [Brassica napus]